MPAGQVTPSVTVRDGDVLPEAYTSIFCCEAAQRFATCKFLRHAFATLNSRTGTSVNDVSQLLGHSSLVITLSNFAQVIEGVAREAVNVLANSLIRRAIGTEGARAKWPTATSPSAR